MQSRTLPAYTEGFWPYHVDLGALAVLLLTSSRVLPSKLRLALKPWQESVVKLSEVSRGAWLILTLSASNSAWKGS
jgi:hypothetical protein